MTWSGSLLWLGGLLFTAVGFLIGKTFSQSEKILDQKRKCYEDFLRVCPAPNEAHGSEEPAATEMQRAVGLLSIYGSSDAIKFAGAYFAEFAKAQPILQSVSEAGHPKFLEQMSHYNRMIWAMRNDAMLWSAFAPARRAREYKASFK
jgi:hypothetical protein